MLESLNFGDVFYYQEQEYIFLAMGASGISYAARILNTDHSKMLVKSRDLMIKNRGEKAVRDIIAYCFVQLRSEKFNNLVATLNQAGSQKNPGGMLISRPKDTVCKEDILTLRDEILTGPVPAELRTIVETLNFDEV